MTDPRYTLNPRLGCHEFYPDPCPEPSMDPPDEDEDYDPYEIDEAKGDRALETARETGRWGIDLS